MRLCSPGDSYHVRRLADDLEKNFPEDTSVKFSYIPVIRRVLALNPEEPETAIGMLQNATPYELGAPRSNL